MSKRSSYVVIGLIVLMAVVLVCGGGHALWHMLLRMHGMH